MIFDKAHYDFFKIKAAPKPLNMRFPASSLRFSSGAKKVYDKAVIGASQTTAL